MHRGLDKVLIYTIFVLSLARWTTSPDPSQPEYYEEHLAKAVINYRKFIDPVSWSFDAFIDAASGWITQGVLGLLEYNLRFVLKLVSDSYLMTKNNLISATTNVDSIIKVKRVVSEQQMPFETVVCSLVPRLLAFLYICTNDQSGYVQMHRLHSVLCLTMPTIVKEINPVQMDQWIYMCDVKTVRQLLDAKRVLRHFRTTSTTISTEGQQITGASFVRQVFELADGVNLKKRLVTTLQLYSDDSWKKVFRVTVVHFYHEWTAGLEAGQMNVKNVSELYEKLAELNGMYVKKKFSFMNVPLEMMSVPDVVNMMMALAFKKFVAYFELVFNDLFNGNESFSGRSAVNNILQSIGLDKLCYWTPLVLSFLKANCNETADTTVPFGLYLTLCGDWDGFVEMQCPTTLDNAHEMACVKKAIADRLLVNYFKVTREFIGYEDIDVGQETNDYLLRSKVSASKYVSSVYNILENYYVGQGYEFPQWTTSDWLTVKHLLATRNQDPGRPACALGEQTIILPVDGDRPTAEVLLSEAHNFLLPWHSDELNVFAFHAMLFRHAEQMMNEFIHRHAAIVSLYLQYFDGSLDFVSSLHLMVLHPYFHTFGWYVKCARRFRYYLHTPGPREPHGTLSVDYLLPEIENLERNHNMNIVGQSAATNPLSADKVENLQSAWTERQLSTLHGLEYPNKLIQILVNNCMDAVKYVNNFIQIAQDSKIAWKDADNLSVDDCNQFVYDVFLRQTISSMDSN